MLIVASSDGAGLDTDPTVVLALGLISSIRGTPSRVGFVLSAATPFFGFFGQPGFSDV